MSRSPHLLATKLSLSWQLFWIALLPLLLTLSHRNIVAMLVLVAAPSLLSKDLYHSVKRLWQPPRGKKKASQLLFLTLLGLSLYMSLSTLWSPHTMTLDSFLQAPLFILVSSLFLWAPKHYSQNQRVKVLAVFAWATLLGTLFLGLEGLTGGWIRDVVPPEKDSIRDNVATARGVSIALILFPVAALALLRGGLPPYVTASSVRMGAIILAGLGLLIAAQKFDIASNAVTAFAITPVGLFALMRPQLAIKSIYYMYLVALILTPFLALLLPSIETIAQSSTGPVSWLQRLGIWRYSADHIFSSPLQFIFGGGNEYARVLADIGNSVDFKGVPYPLEVMPTHPHNVFMHIWLEFGLIGVMLTSLALWHFRNLLASAFPNPQTISRTYTAALCMVATAVCVYGGVETSLWTFWRLAAPVIATFGLVLIYHLHSSKFHIHTA